MSAPKHARNDDSLFCVFLAAESCRAVQTLLEQRSGKDVLLIAPSEYATDAWCRTVAANYRNWNRVEPDDRALDWPRPLMLFADEIHVFSGMPEPTDAVQRKLAQQLEDLLYDAHRLGIPSYYYHADGTPIEDLQQRLQQREPPRHLANKISLTRDLVELRLDADGEGITGVWSSFEGFLHYDNIDLPLPILRRLALWEQALLYAEDIDEWNRLEQEAINLAPILQEALGGKVPIKIWYDDRWCTVEEIRRLKAGES